MTVTIEEYVPKLINQTVETRERYVVTHERWNELWNLIIEQGDYTANTVRETCLRILAIEADMAALAVGSIPIGTINDDHLSNNTENIKARFATHLETLAPHTGHETPVGAQSKVNTHATQTSPHGATSVATANRLILRDGSGRAQIAAPVQAADIARKAEVDVVAQSLSSHRSDSDRHHKITISETAPLEGSGSDGDIWINRGLYVNVNGIWRKEV